MNCNFSGMICPFSPICLLHLLIGYTPILCYLLLRLFQLWLLGALSHWLLCPLACPCICLALPFWQYKIFPASICPAPPLESAVYPGSPGSFYWWMVFCLFILFYFGLWWMGFRTQNLVAACACCYWDIITSCPFSDKARKHTYVHYSTYTQIFMFMSVSAYIWK